MNLITKLYKKTISEISMNWKAGVSVALISVPLSLSLAIASGSTPLAGIITAIWASLVAAIIGGSKFNIVGPAGALTGILVVYANQYGSGVLPIIAIVAGFFALICWLFRWDRYLMFVPSAVVHGFTLGVAITIASGQINSALGLKNLPQHEKLLMNIWESLKNILHSSPTSVIIFLVSIVIMFVLFRISPKIPNSIIIAVMGIGFGYLTYLKYIPIDVVKLMDKNYVLTPTLFQFLIPEKVIPFLTLIEAGAVVGFVVVLETLISAKVADAMTKTKFNERKEVLGVALGNLASGLTGGLPASGVFARTAMNIRSGAKSNWAGIINAVVVIVLSFVILPWFSYIPMAVIAAILIYVSIRMVATHHFVSLYKFDKSAFYNSILVAILVVAYDATTGILVGALISLVVFANKTANLGAHVTEHAEDGSKISTDSQIEKMTHTVIYRFAGALTYVNARGHVYSIEELSRDTKAVVFNMKNLFYIDSDGLESLDEMYETAHNNGCKVFVTAVSENLLEILNSRSWFRKLFDDKLVFVSTHEAVKHVITLGDLKKIKPDHKIW